MTNQLKTRDSILRARAEIPTDVVFRGFANETIVLNLNTGKYHGLNATAGRMLDVLASSDSVGAAARVLAEEYERPLELIQHDLCEFCFGLQRRGLLDLD